MPYVEFSFQHRAQLERVRRVFEALKEAKRADDFRDDAYWLSFFDGNERAAFWWPSDAELRAWRQRWLDTPTERRATDATLHMPWGFGSMIDAFANGHYQLLDCRAVNDERARLEFEPTAYPFGGTGCMHALVEAFGCEVVAEDLPHPST